MDRFFDTLVERWSLLVRDSNRWVGQPIDRVQDILIVQETLLTTQLQSVVRTVEYQLHCRVESSRGPVDVSIAMESSSGCLFYHRGTETRSHHSG